MPSSADLSLAEFAEELASPAPAPGACAVPAALAAGLVAMVARSTAAGDPFSHAAEEMEALAREADGLRVELLRLAEEDADAFERVLRARRTGLRDEIQDAYEAAVDPPTRLCRRALRVLELALEVATEGNPFASADSGSAALLSAATLESAALNVQLELGAIEDEEFRNARAEAVDHLLDEAQKLRAAALAAVLANLDELASGRTRSPALV